MRGKIIGFYWTLPVPRVGFTCLPRDVDAAAKASKTIRYQRELTHRWARDNVCDVILEDVFIELQPDRGSDMIVEPLDRLSKQAEQEAATIVYVDFSHLQGWRSHHLMRSWIRGVDGDRIIGLPPAPLPIDGEWFDPQEHFGKWRGENEKWLASKVGRIETIRHKIEGMRRRAGSKASYPAIADFLNSDGVVTTTGKQWSAESVRKFMTYYMQDGPPSRD